MKKDPEITSRSRRSVTQACALAGIDYHPERFERSLARMTKLAGSALLF